MRVEFMDTNGTGLFITAQEFAKANKKQAEFTSLQMAVHGFGLLFGINWRIDKDVYAYNSLAI